MRLTIEFFGAARRLSRKKKVTLEVDDDVTLRDLNAELARQFPAFLGQLIIPETHELVDSYYFYNFYAGRAVQKNEKLKDGDRLLLMFVDAGG